MGGRISFQFPEITGFAPASPGEVRGDYEILGTFSFSKGVKDGVAGPYAWGLLEPLTKLLFTEPIGRCIHTYGWEEGLIHSQAPCFICAEKPCLREVAVEVACLRECGEDVKTVLVAVLMGITRCTT
jgi:hypothetical protein